MLKKMFFQILRGFNLKNIAKPFFPWGNQFIRHYSELILKFWIQIKGAFWSDQVNKRRAPATLNTTIDWRPITTTITMITQTNIRVEVRPIRAQCRPIRGLPNTPHPTNSTIASTVRWVSPAAIHIETERAPATETRPTRPSKWILAPTAPIRWWMAYKMWRRRLWTPWCPKWRPSYSLKWIRRAATGPTRPPCPPTSWALHTTIRIIIMAIMAVRWV